MRLTRAASKGACESERSRQCAAKTDDDIGGSYRIPPLFIESGTSRIFNATKPQKHAEDPYEIASQCVKRALNLMKNRKKEDKVEQGPESHSTKTTGISKNNKLSKGDKLAGKSVTSGPVATNPSRRHSETPSGGVVSKRQLVGSSLVGAFEGAAKVPSLRTSGRGSAAAGDGTVAQDNAHLRPEGELGSIGPLRGEVVSVLKDEGKLRSPCGKLKTFSSKHCFLHGVELHGLDLNLIFRLGMQLSYTVEDAEQTHSPPSPLPDWGGDAPQVVWVREGEFLLGEALVPAVRNWCGQNMVTGSGRRRLVTC